MGFQKTIAMVLGASSIALFCAMSPSYAGGDLALTPPSPRTAAVPAVSSSGSPVVTFNARGVVAFANDSVGACAGQTCTVSSCFCHEYTGTVTASQLGKSLLDAKITVDEQGADITNTGTDSAECFPTSGLATLTAGSKSVQFEVTGHVCQFLSGGEFELNYDESYYIIPGNGSGATQNSTGSGNLVLVLNEGSSSSNPAIVSMNGAFQKNP